MEYDRQIVSGHLTDFWLPEAVQHSAAGDTLDIAQTPFRIARPQFVVERHVARRCLHTASQIWAVEEEDAALVKDGFRTTDESFRSRPRRDMNHVQTNDRCRGSYLPRQFGHVEAQWG